MAVFVQIASYRDPQLLPTLRDCVAKAKHPFQLRFCIAWQHDPSESLEEFANDSRFTILDIPYQESEGVCWARNLIQENYCGEQYTLALDSHHRFIQGWDQICIDLISELQASGHQKPLLTAYAPPYDPDNDPMGRAKYSTAMAFDRFTRGGVVLFKPIALPDKLSNPVRARFVSAHFIFTIGQFCLEVPHDPNYYFLGEEINLSVRAYTHGYDAFHPHRVVCWHEYSRRGRVKQWDDDSNWHLRNRRALARNRRLLGMDPVGSEDFGKYGLGVVRSLHDYEKYAGVHFKRRAVQQHTLSNLSPPNPVALAPEETWEDSFSTPFKHQIVVDMQSVIEVPCKFWAFIYLDETRSEVFRSDLAGAQLQELISAGREAGGEVSIEWEFPAFRGRKPRRWVVWPYSNANGWLRKFESEV